MMAVLDTSAAVALACGRPGIERFSDVVGEAEIVMVPELFVD